MKFKKKTWILLVLAGGTLVLDQWTKWLVRDHFYLGESVSIVRDFFNLTYVRNTGAAFGILAKADPGFRIPFFLIVPVLALIVIGLIFKKTEDSHLRMATALSLVMGGAVGNLIDRVFLGYVVDFLDFHWRYQIHFPAFNVADMSICVGVGLLMLDLMLQSGGDNNASPSV